MGAAATAFVGAFNAETPPTYSVFDCDHVVWMGDLNYRLDLDDEVIKSKIKEADFDTLLQADQLLKAQLNDQAFRDFQEGTINFMPTYKYDIGTNDFDTSEKKRSPAWCDRILWRSKAFNMHRINQIYYRGHMEMLSSDHKPVSAQFGVLVKTINHEQQVKVHSAILRELDKYENECMPDAKVSPLFFDFGEIAYLVPKVLSLTIENVGQVFLQFRFVPKLEQESYCKPWLWVNPHRGVLLPGETISISMTILVDATSAPALNTRQDSLDDILILHLENGKDYFLSISGQYQPTCFAQNLATLMAHKGPVRPLTGHVYMDYSKPLSVPTELWRMVDFIQHNGQHLDALFLSSGDQGLIQYIRECLDTGEDFDKQRLLANHIKQLSRTASVQSFTSLEDVFDEPTSLTVPQDAMHHLMPSPLLGPKRRSMHDSDEESQLEDEWIGVHSMAECLLKFLQALPEPVVPSNMYEACLQATDRELALAVLEGLSDVHLKVFLYLTSFLRQVIALGDVHDTLRVEKLAVVFASVLLRAPPNYIDKDANETTKRKKTFLLHLLTDDDLYTTPDDIVLGEAMFP
jgi:phosphatidylinositol-bisphosphatase